MKTETVLTQIYQRIVEKLEEIQELTLLTEKILFSSAKFRYRK
jgi:hypothetical protein